MIPWSETTRISGDARRGIILPVVLLLTSALGAAAISLLVLARGERVIEGLALRMLAARVSAEWRLDAQGEGPVPPDGGLVFVPLPGGYQLVRGSGASNGFAYSAVLWYLDADSLAALLPGAVEVGHAPPSNGVSLLGSECPGGGTGPLVQVRSFNGTPADPPVSPGPRLGPLGLERLLDLSTAMVAPSGHFSGGVEVPILRVPVGLEVVGGEIESVVLSDGDLILRGTALVRGIVLAAGDVEIAESARIEGIVLAGGTIRLSDAGQVLGCRAFAAERLRHPLFSGFHGVSGGERLGRF
jgi:hypothetical protein